MSDPDAARFRTIAPTDRVEFLVEDVRSLVRRWPADRWSQPALGLPAGVWVASALEVLARAWPGAPPPLPVVPTVAGVDAALEGWRARLAAWPLGAPSAATRALATAVTAAEARIRALDQAGSRPRRPR